MIGKQSHQTKPQPSSERWNKIFVWFQRFSWRASPTPYKIQFLQEDSFTTRCITYPPTHRPWYAVTLLSYMHTYNIVQKFGNEYFRVKIYLYSYNNSCIKYTKCLIFSSKDFVDEKKYELIRRLVKTYLLRKKIYSRLAYLLYIFYINYSQNIRDN